MSWYWKTSRRRNGAKPSQTICSIGSIGEYIKCFLPIHYQWPLHFINIQFHSQVRGIVEYLLSETDYTKKDIASTPSILYYSLEAIKTRVELLRMEGLPFPYISQFAQGHKRFKKLITKLKNDTAHSWSTEWMWAAMSWRMVFAKWLTVPEK